MSTPVSPSSRADQQLRQTEALNQARSKQEQQRSAAAQQAQAERTAPAPPPKPSPPTASSGNKLNEVA